MIQLNVGTRSYPLSREEAVYMAESLLSAAGGKSGMPPYSTAVVTVIFPCLLRSQNRQRIMALHQLRLSDQNHHNPITS